MDILTKDAILGFEDIEYDDVNCPEWGGSVRVRSLMAKERDIIEASMTTKKGQIGDLRNFRARVVAYGLVDEFGERMFVSQKDISDLGKKSAIVIDRLFDRIREMSGMTEEAVEEEIKDLEEGQEKDSSLD